MDTKNPYSQYKLLKHLDRLTKFEKEGFTDPIFIDLDLTNRCNNRCPLCLTDKITNREKNNLTMDFDTAKDLISQLKDSDAKAITFAGGGEPTCHPNLEELIRFTKQKEIDVALFTNGYNLTENTINTIVKDCSWIRISLDADSPEIYNKTHGMKEKAFYKVIDNISKLTHEKKQTKSDIVIGVCYLIGSQSVKGIYNAAKLTKKLRVDNIRFRPFFNWEDSEEFPKQDVEKMFSQLEMAKELENKQFLVSYTEKRCESTKKEITRPFKECYVPHFMTSITPDLKVYPCCPFKNKEKYCLGDLTKETFKDIWFSEQRKKVHEKIDLKECPNPCNFQEHAELLYLIKNQILHSNFL